MKLLKATILGFIFVLATGCTPKINSTTDAVTTVPQKLHAMVDSLDTIEIQIVDLDLAAIPDAQVLIGDEKTPLTTDPQGKILIPSEWTGEEAITISKVGYITTTYLNRLPEKNVFQIKRQPPAVLNVVTGSTSGYDNLKNDGWVDFGMVLQPMSQSDVMAFDINRVISPEMDNMTVMGQTVGIPSNISIPSQKETYILPLTIAKPVYRSNFDSVGAKRLVANHGHFQLKPVIQKLQGGGSFLDVINDIEFESLQVTDFNISSQTTNLDLGVAAIALDSKINSTAPTFDAKQVFFTVAFIKDSAKDADRYLPTDIKSYASGQTLQIAYPSPDHPRHVLTLLGEKKQVGKNVSLSPRMSIALSTLDAAPTSELLDLVADPVVQNGKLTVTPPAAKAGINSMGTLIVLSHVEKTESSEKVNVSWEIYAPDWVSEYTLPAGFDAATQNSRVEITFLGTVDSTPNKSLGPTQTSGSTHASRNAVDFN